MTLVDIDLLFSGATTNCKYRGIENVLFSNTAFLLKNSNLHPWQRLVGILGFVISKF